MRIHWSLIVVLAGLGCTLAGCQGTRERKLRQPIPEEFTTVPNDRKFSDPPYYPEEKTKLPGPKAPTSPQLPSMRSGPSPGGPLPQSQ